MITQDIFNKVSDFCSEFEKDKEIKVSDATCELVVLLLRSITEDPHPSWRDEPSILEEKTQYYVSQLSVMLEEIVRTERVLGRITPFDFLHWVSKTSFECIITK